MNADKQFFEAVKRMRDLQKKYFDTRDAATLTKAKRAEHEVDQIILVRECFKGDWGKQGRLI